MSDDAQITVVPLHSKKERQNINLYILAFTLGEEYTIK